MPRGFHDLIRERNIDAADAVAADVEIDQGPCLVGTLLTRDGTVIRFDVEFAGDGDQPWTSWGEVVSIQEWHEGPIPADRPGQGTLLGVASRMVREGRL